MSNVDQSKLTGVQKAWIYNEHLIIPSIRWELTIYEFGLTFVETLNSSITKYLKKWFGITRSADTSILYRSKDNFRLNLPNITTVYKSAQIGREFKMKCSKDSDIQSFYTAKYQVQSLKKNWNSTKHRERQEEKGRAHYHTVLPCPLLQGGDETQGDANTYGENHGRYP